MELPPEYTRDLEARQRRAGALADAARAGSITLQAMLLELIADSREFYARWAPRIPGTKELDHLEAYRTRELPRMEASVEMLWLTSLARAVERRSAHANREILRQENASYLADIREAHSRRNERRRRLGLPEEEMDAAAAHRKAEADQAESEARQERAGIEAKWAGLAAEWPGRVDAALQERWKNFDPVGAAAWMKKIRASIDAQWKPILVRV